MALLGLVIDDDKAWARHANPWSGWTRFVTCLPLLILAIWSRAWIGWWSLIPTAAALYWIWLNPRAFPPVQSDQAWISRGVFGERFWTRRDEINVPKRHHRILNTLNLVSSSGLIFIIWGLIALNIWPTLLGIFLSIGGKLWYVDRMVWLYEDIVAAHPEHRYKPEAVWDL